ncbi:hepcidin [Rhineura floridana]|uniref:hepcidin n=1 Tax=Rhineura floridana TaxID=261503 RepID=UPI002AC80AF7|nr:hepcidin [Rhineura floridana]
MKLQLVCIIFILLSAATRNVCAVKLQTEVEKDLTSLDTYKAEPMTNIFGLQTLLRRSKRFNSHFPICTYCCNCCRNKGCGMCCRT